MEHEIKYAFRMVHIENIPHVLEYGFVHKDSCNADPNYIPIGDTSVIRVREERAVIGVNLQNTLILKKVLNLLNQKFCRVKYRL